MTIITLQGRRAPATSGPCTIRQSHSSDSLRTQHEEPDSFRRIRIGICVSGATAASLCVRVFERLRREIDGTVSSSASSFASSSASSSASRSIWDQRVRFLMVPNGGVLKSPEIITSNRLD